MDNLVARPQAVGDIARSFQLAQPTVSTHLKYLREAGIVSATKSGGRVQMEVDRQAVLGLIDELRALVGS